MTLTCEDVDMGTAPLSRDKQIEMMMAAKERHAAHAERWISSPQVKDVLTLIPDSDGSAPRGYLRRDEKIARCG